jgi:hypothetical protein
MNPTQTIETTVMLTCDEKNYLVRTLQNAVGETRVEVHRTHTPQFRDRVLEEEHLIRGLLTKLEKSA